MRNSKIVIIGSGKLTNALVSGFINSGMNPRLITVIGRNPENLKNFLKHGVNTSCDFEEVRLAEFVILAVTPNGAGPVLLKLKSLRFGTSHQPRSLISFVSGLLPYKIIEVLGISSDLITVATTNTNISKNEGILCLLKTTNVYAQELLEPLGKIIVENSDADLILSIMSVGSMNAFDARALELLYENSNSPYSLYNWLSGLMLMFEGYETNYDSYLNVEKYISAKAKALAWYSEVDAMLRSRMTLESTIDTLIKIGSQITIEDIRSITKSVVTKGGCTEKGIGQINNLSDLYDSNTLKKVFTLVADRALNFPLDVESSF